MIKHYFFFFLLLLASSGFAMEMDLEPSPISALEAQIKTLIDTEQSKHKAYEQLRVIAQENEKTIDDLHDLFEYYWEQKHPDYLTYKLPHDVLGLIVKQIIGLQELEDEPINLRYRKVRALAEANKAMARQVPECCMQYVQKDEDFSVYVFDATQVNAIKWVEEWLKSNPPQEDITAGELNCNLLIFAITQVRPAVVRLLKSYLLGHDSNSLQDSFFASNPYFFKDIMRLFEEEKATLSAETLMEQAIKHHYEMLVAYLYHNPTLNFKLSPMLLYKFASLEREELSYLKSQDVFKSVDIGGLLIELIKNIEKDPTEFYEISDPEYLSKPGSGVEWNLDNRLKSLLTFFAKDIDCWPLYLHCIERILLSDEALKKVSGKERSWYWKVANFAIKADKKSVDTKIKLECITLLSYFSEFGEDEIISISDLKKTMDLLKVS